MQITDGKNIYELLEAAAPAARREHPQCGFVRREKGEAMSCTLYTPEGKLTCLYDPRDGRVLKPFLKRQKDMTCLNAFLKCVEHFPVSGAPVRLMGPSPEHAMRLFCEENAKALAVEDAALFASILRKLERAALKKAELALEGGAALLVFEDKPILEGANEEHMREKYTTLAQKLALPFMLSYEGEMPDILAPCRLAELRGDTLCLSGVPLARLYTPVLP